MLLASGAKVAISKVKAGDKVEATDPYQNVTAARPVVKVIRHHRMHAMAAIVLVTGAVIQATSQHPIWDATTHTFTYAASLRPGDKLLEPNGTTIAVQAVRHYQADLTAYNLDVSGIHTYYVLAGTTAVLVHNSCTWVDEGGNLRAGKGPGMKSDAYDYQSGASGARSNAVTGRSSVPQLDMPALDGSTVTVKFDSMDENEIIDRKLSPFFSAKAVDQAREQAATSAYNGLQAVWELPTAQDVADANRFMSYAGISNIRVRVGS